MAGIQRNPQQRSNNLCVNASSSFIALDYDALFASTSMVRQIW
jgi:hypothetical protein